LLRTDQINVMPVNNPYGAVVLGMDTSNVDTVFVAGKMMKSQGRLSVWIWPHHSPVESVARLLDCENGVTLKHGS
jgi:cytosine/adenosine deaminase-related metal-dependent hydrolase